MDRIKTRTYYFWLSKTGITHWILLKVMVDSYEELCKLLQAFKRKYDDVGQVFTTINTPKEYLINIGEDDDIYEFVQEQE